MLKEALRPVANLNEYMPKPVGPKVMHCRALIRMFVSHVYAVAGLISIWWRFMITYPLENALDHRRPDGAAI